MSKIITLCGSTKFKKEFEYWNKQLTLEGNIVLSVGVFGHSDNSVQLTQAQKDLLDAVHLQKIDLCDEVFFLNVGGYLGESSRRELGYSIKKDKQIRFLEGENK